MADLLQDTDLTPEARLENYNAAARAHLCCLFEQSIPEPFFENFDVVKRYGSEYIGSDGKTVHSLHTWDDGYRTLCRCSHCGQLFLHQVSEYHNFFDGRDDYYDDYFQVVSEEHAELLNRLYNGYEIERINLPHIFRTNGEIGAFK